MFKLKQIKLGLNDDSVFERLENITGCQHFPFTAICKKNPKKNPHWNCDNMELFGERPMGS